MPTFKVLRRLDGDRLYEPGDTRELSATDAKALVASGALEEVKGKSTAKDERANEPIEATADAAPADEPVKTAKRRGRAKK